MRTLAITCLILVSVCPAKGVLIDVLEAPHDDPAIRKSVQKRAEAKRLNKEYNAVLERYFFGLRSSRARTVFGPRLRQLPRSRVLPVFIPTWIGLSGAVDPSTPDKRHSAIYALGDTGYVDLYFHRDGKRLETAVLYFRPDRSFVPLKSSSDISPRIAWEKKKWAVVKDWLRRTSAWNAKRPNQAMQLTASKRDVYGWSVCRL